MDKDRLNLWLGFGKFFLGTVVLGLVTTFVNNKIQEREIELKELDQLGQFMVHALDEDVGKRRRFAQYFARVTRSSELRSGWERYEQLVQKEFDDTKSEFEKTRVALAEAQKRGEPQTFEVLRLQSDLDRLRAAIEVAPSASARVFVHIRSEEQRALAKQVIEALQRQGVLGPALKRLLAVRRGRNCVTSMRRTKPMEKHCMAL